MRRVRIPDLDDLAVAAEGNPRLRETLELHLDGSDPVQRFFNAMEPGTYVRPHRHTAERWEVFVAIRGQVGLIEFDDGGRVLAAVVLDPGSVVAAEIPGGTWHTVVALATGSTLFEVKPGPYVPSKDKEFAPWAPTERDASAAALVPQWEHLLRLAGRSDQAAPIGRRVSDPRD